MVVGTGLWPAGFPFPEVGDGRNPGSAFGLAKCETRAVIPEFRSLSGFFFSRYRESSAPVPENVRWIPAPAAGLLSEAAERATPGLVGVAYLPFAASPTVRGARRVYLAALPVTAVTPGAQHAEMNGRCGPPCAARCMQKAWPIEDNLPRLSTSARGGDDI